MKIRAAVWFAGLFSIIGAQASPALAAGSYYVGTTVDSNSVLWVYSPTTNLVKLCYSTTSHTLACTPTQPVFAAVPLATDNLQFRISQNSLTGGLWMIDLTTNKQALCEAALTSVYTVTCTLGSGLK